jgi:hypothetical protein
MIGLLATNRFILLSLPEYSVSRRPSACYVYPPAAAAPVSPAAAVALPPQSLQWGIEVGYCIPQSLTPESWS